MSANKNLFWSLIASVGIYTTACTTTHSVASNQNKLSAPDSNIPKKEVADTIDYYKRFNSIVEHQTTKPQAYLAHSTQFAECKTPFTQGSTVSRIGINTLDSTYYLNIYDNHANYQGVHESVTAYMGTYDQQDSAAKAMLPAAEKEIVNSKIKREPYSHALFLVSAPDSNIIEMVSPEGGYFKRKTLIDLKKQTISECTCEDISDVTKRRFQRNTKLVQIAEKFQHSKKYQVGNRAHYIH